MITVKINLQDDSVYFSMNGHADYASKNDIVCAGCSAIYYALLGMLENLEGHVKNLLTVEKSGAVMICCDGDELAITAFTMATIGLMQIEKAYPDHVKVILSKSVR